PSKIEAVKNWEALRIPSEKSKTFDWGEEQEAAFQTLKDMLCNAPFLALLDRLKDFVVYYDASCLGLGYMLMQRGKVIAYASRQLKSSIKDKILAAQNKASEAVNASAEMLRGLDEQMKRRSDRKMYYLDRIWVPLKGDVRTLIVDEAHKSKYSVHPRANKMYYDLRDVYWWLRMKKDIALLMVRASVLFKPWKTCSEHASLTSREVEMFIFHRLNSHTTTIAIILALGPEIVQETTDKISQIKDRLKTKRDRQKSYAYKRIKPLEFSVGILLRFSFLNSRSRISTSSSTKFNLASTWISSKGTCSVGSAKHFLRFDTETYHERHLAPQTGGRTGRGGGRTGEPTGRVDAQGGDQGSQANNILGDVRNVRNVNVNNSRDGCSYKEFMACNPKDYKGKGGAIGYTRWIEKMESVQDMSGCGDNQKVKYTAGSFITETKFWCHAMVGAGHATYTDRSHELARLVPHSVTLENKMIERYIYGLAPHISAMVAATEPTTIQSVVQKSRMLTDEAIRNESLKKNTKKRGNDREPSRDGNDKDDNKRFKTMRAFSTVTNPARKEYTGTDCKVGPRMVNLLNARNLIVARGRALNVVVLIITRQHALGTLKGIHAGSRGGSLGIKHYDGYVLFKQSLCYNSIRFRCRL
nr:hypothetical protein [Tanacetum cinerariifolium]